MIKISHSDAIELEYLVRRVYDCDRGGVSGLADADHFEHNPLDAAKLIIAYIHANKLQNSETQYDEFLHDFEVYFEYPEENGGTEEVKRYIKELAKLVDTFVR